MDRIIEGGSPIRGIVSVPGDKSISHRALIFGALSSGQSNFTGLSTAKDVETTKNILKELGIQFNNNKDEDNKKALTINGIGIGGFEKLRKSSDKEIYELYCGNSGTTARLIMGLLGGAGIKAEITGDNSLSQRPMDRVVEPLKSIGVEIESTQGHLPVRIIGGKAVPFNYTLQVASAQVKSAMILAALFINGTSTIIEPQETRDHTERMLLLMDGDIMIKRLLNGKNIMINGRKELTPLSFKIPGDISSAIFFIAAALIIPGSEITIEHVLLNPTRAHIFEVLKRMGAKIDIEQTEEFPEPVGNVKVTYSKLKGTRISSLEVPLIIDEIPALAAIAFYARGKTIVTGASELRVKESDRIKSITTMIKSFGGNIEEKDDGFIIKGRKRAHPSQVESFGDHRIAMAASILAMTVKGKNVIKNSKCVEISFPEFFQILESVKAET